MTRAETRAETNTSSALSRVAPRALIALGLVLGLAGAGIWRAFADPGPRRLLEPTPVDLARAGRLELDLAAPAQPGRFEVVLECQRTPALPFKALNLALLGDDFARRAPTLRATARVLADGRDLGLESYVGGRWARDTVGRGMAGFAATPGRAYRLVLEVETPTPELAATNPRVEVVEAFDKQRYIDGSIQMTLARLAALPLLSAGLLFGVGGCGFEWRRRRAARG